MSIPTDIVFPLGDEDKRRLLACMGEVGRSQGFKETAKMLTEIANTPNRIVDNDTLRYIAGSLEVKAAEIRASTDKIMDEYDPAGRTERKSPHAKKR